MSSALSFGTGKPMTVRVFLNLEKAVVDAETAERNVEQIKNPDKSLPKGRPLRLNLGWSALARTDWDWMRGIEELRLTTLAVLDLNDGGLTELPSSIGDIPTLIRLRLHSNSLKVLPEGVGNLKNLQVLSAYSNNLTSLPESLRQLTNLKTLRLGGNQLKARNISFFAGSDMLTSLVELYLRENQLLYRIWIPQDITSQKMEGRLRLDTDGCPYSPPVTPETSSCRLL